MQIEKLDDLFLSVTQVSQVKVTEVGQGRTRGEGGSGCMYSKEALGSNQRCAVAEKGS